MIGVIGFLVKSYRDDHKTLAQDHKNLAARVDSEFNDCVKKDDFRDVVGDLKDQNAAIFAKLDRQDDKLDRIQEAVASKADRREVFDQKGTPNA